MLVAGYKLPPMMFTDEEALALSVGLLAARGLGLAGTAPGVAGAQAKLERVMPADLRRRVRAADDTMAWTCRASRLRGRGRPGRAQRRRPGRPRVHLSYRSAESALTEREFDPYGLAYRGGCWYAVGHCHLRKGLRSFRIDRIHGVRATEARSSGRRTSMPSAISSSPWPRSRARSRSRCC
jgi:predicted DNA-binding transcriptional regulator YafY